MHSFFDAMTPWAHDDGSLHVYALPDPDTAERLAALASRLDGVDHLPTMPRTWLHLTVSRLAQFDDIGQAELTRLCAALSARLDGVGPLEVDLGSPAAGATGVACDGATTPPWDALVGAVRAAAADVSDEPLPPGPHGPHVSLAYATGPADDAEVAARLAGATPVGAVPVTEVHLVSVTVRPETGTFDWTELATFDL